MEIVIFNINKILLVFLLSLIISCSKDQKTLTDNGEGITIGFLEGLNDNPTYQLSKKCLIWQKVNLVFWDLRV